MKEAIKIEETWDKKKIVIGIALLLVLLGCLVYFSGIYKIKSASSENAGSQLKKTVKGVETSINAEGIKKAVQQKIEEIKTEAGSIDLVEIASSSPQVQKVINDLKALEKYPSDQAKGMCQKLCDQL
jgi:hypothetical protein